MTDIPTGRDLVPPVPPSDEPDIPEGLALGIDLEEFYFFFGEGEQLLYAALGLGTGVPAPLVNKLDRIRAALWSLPDGANLVRQLDDILAQMSTSAATSADLERIREESMHLERLLDGLMPSVRQALPDNAGYWYDLGVFLARLHLCLTIIESPPTGTMLKQSQETYLLELRRVVPLFVTTFLRLMRRPSTYSSPTPLIRSLVVLARDMTVFDQGLPDWYRTAREHADEVFTSIGTIYSGENVLFVVAGMIEDHKEKSPAKEPVTEAPDPSVELSRQHSRHREALLSNAPEVAEEGLRTLLATARRRLGPYHPLVFMIQSDLSMALLALGRIPLCTELALDAADEAAFHLGDRHPVTAGVAHGTLLMLIATGRTDEAATLFHNRLAWLLAAKPNDLSDELRMVRDILLPMTAADQRRASS